MNLNYKLAIPISLILWFLPLGPASALPVFAHRYGLSCQTCHSIVPELNAFGNRFKAGGFRLPEPRPTFPIAVKVKLAYSSAPEDGLPKTVTDEIELLTGGAAGKHFGYFIEQYVVDGGLPGSPRDVWLEYHNSDFHLRGGQFTLPLPVDVETQRKTESHYLVYDQRVGDSAFNFFDPRLGADASFVNAADTFEAHLALLESYDRQSGVPVSGVDRMITLRATRGNLSGWFYHYAGQRELETGTDRFTRTGYALSTDGSARLTAMAALQTGFDSRADEDGNGARSSGGFLEATFRLNPALWLTGRYEGIYDDLSGVQRQGVVSLVFRPAANMRLTVEDRMTNRHELGATFLFAY